MKARALKSSFDGSPEVQLLLLKYTQSLITQMSQTAICNRHHLLEAQVCKRLLLTLDRLSSSALMMTHELIANMLGVRREGVSVAAFRLQRDGLIRYSRGCIEVLDRSGLEHRACECYGVLKRECTRLLPEVASIADTRRAGVAMRPPEGVPGSCAQAVQRVSRKARKPQVSAHPTSATPPRNLGVGRQLQWAAASRPRASLAGGEAFLAMSAIMSGARTDPATIAA